MKRSIFLKLAMTLTAMFFISGVFAQITLVVKNMDGTASGGSVVYTINSSTGVATPVVTVEAPAGTHVWTPAVARYNYIVRNSGSSQWNSYSVDYTVATGATINLRTNFNPTIQEYGAVRTGDKVTNGKALPYWVFPSPVHNPSWAAPVAIYATQATIETNLVSTFGWQLNGAAFGGATNYVEVTPAGNLVAAATTTSAMSLRATETASGAFGGCTGAPVYFYNTVINPPYAEITGTAASAPLTISAAGFRQIAKGCVGDASLTTNIALNFSNTNEEFPFYMRLIYNVYNPTFVGNDMTLGAAQTFPAGLRPQSTVVGGDANQTTNPMTFSSYTPNVYGAAATFTLVNNTTTVYEFDLNTWNGKISRKSDYIAWRTSGVTPAVINSNTYSWYSNAVIANTFDASAYYKKAYIIVFPTPNTGPIYHIPNIWGV